MRTKIGIINVTGYAGSEIARILHNHPDVEITSITGRSSAGKKVGEVYPHLSDINLNISEEISGNPDVIFSALPHAASAEKIQKLINNKVKIIDISADFRLKNIDIWESTYQIKHPCPENINKAIYGLPEIYKKEIKNTNLVANPGCFPTGAILANAPLLKENIIEPSIINDSKTGISGAGRTSKLEFGFSEINENCTAYGLTGHRHQPEIEQELNNFSNEQKVKVTFVPHLVPMTRGILGTNYSVLTKNMHQKEIMELYRDFYSDSPFVKISEVSPSTKQTWGNNNCIIYPYINQQNGIIVVVTALDNLVKGAAGAAVQNMNLMLNIPEETGLEQLAIYP
jgi:N-acetyl-gamma-glutamyl-phosphate reductase